MQATFRTPVGSRFLLRVVRAFMVLIPLLVLAAHAQTFPNPLALPIGGSPGACCTADVNSDGVSDIIAPGTGTITIFLNNGHGAFSAQSVIAMPSASATITPSLAVGDVNGDGKPDIVATASTLTGIVAYTFLGNGDGTFNAPQTSVVYNPPFGSNVSALFTPQLADFNNDNALDLVFYDTSSALYVALGDGHGNFSTGKVVAGNGNPYVVAIADFTGDGKTDILVPWGTTFHLLPGNGDGTFGAPILVNGDGTFAASILTLDLNGDGKTDIVYSSSTTFVILLNAGGGNFTVSSQPATIVGGLLGYVDLNSDGVRDIVTNVPGLAVYTGKASGGFGSPILTSAPDRVLSYTFFPPVDLNGDGIPDLVMPSASSYHVFFGKGDGTFLSADLYNTTEQAEGIVLGDFNGNGKTDIAVTVNAAFPRLLFGDGKGAFTLAPDPNATTVPVVTYPNVIGGGDFNGDGKTDIVQRVYSSTTGYTYTALLSRGDGTFTSTPLTDGSTFVADFNGDGLADIASAGTSGSNVSIFVNAGRHDGTFALQTQPITNIPAYDNVLGVGDINKDGKPDLILCGSSDHRLFVALGNGDNTFTGVPSPACASNQGNVVVADLDIDGTPDILLSTSAGLTVYYGLGDGMFDSGTKLNLSVSGNLSPITSVAVADMDGDGRPDIIYINNGLVQIAHNLGNRNFGAPSAFVGGYQLSQVAVADLNGDGKPDIVVADATNAISVLLNQGSITGTKATMSVTPEPSYATDPLTVTVSLTGIANSAIPSGSVSLKFDTTAVGSQLLTKGAATFTFTPSYFSLTGPVGTHTLTLSYSGDSNYTTNTFSSTHAVVVKPIPVTITLAASPTSALRSQTIRLVATTTAAPDSTITPIVLFSADGVALGLSPLANGTATLDTNLLAPGTHSLIATYIGFTNPAYGISYPETASTPVPVTIAAVPTTTTLSASSTTIAAGTPVTLTADVTATSGQPFGSVTFFDGSSTLGTALLTGGTATWTTAVLSAGTHTLSAAYNANQTFASSTSATLPLQAHVSIGAPESVLALSILNPPNPTELPLLRATIATTSASLPAALVSFFDNGTFLGSATTNSSGLASWALPSTQGTHNFIAILQDASTHRAASSPALSLQTVAAPEFTFSLGATTRSIAPGTSSAAPISFTSSVATAPLWSCLPSSAALTCEITGPAMQPVLSLHAASAQNRIFFASLSVIALLLLPFARRRRIALSLVLALAVILLVPLSGCGTAPLPHLAVVTVSATRGNSIQAQQLLVFIP